MRTLLKCLPAFIVLAWAQPVAAQQTYGGLPAGAATSARQDTANASLATIATALTTFSAGTSASAALPVQGVTGGVPMPVAWSGQSVGISGTLPGFASTPTVKITSSAAAARNFPGCTVGTTSGSCLAAGTAATFLQAQNTSATATIACAFGATAALNAAGSFQLAPGQSASWGPATGGVPTGALNCVASAASTPLYVEWN